MQRPGTPSLRFEIFAISLAAILLEITYTRVFSFKVYYYFTYLILGVALLGLGGGGVLVATSRRLRGVRPERLVAASALSASLSVLLGYFVIAPAPLDVSAFADRPVELLKLAAVMGLLALPFLCTGIAVSTILSTRPEEVGRLYGADLLGAALGCALVVPLLDAITPPGAVMFAAAAYAGAALRHPAASASVRALGIGAVLAACAGILLHDQLPDPVTDAGKQFEAYRDGDLLLFSAWNPVFRVDVSKHPLRPDLYVLHHDGLPGSGIHRFDGDLSKQLRFLRDPRVLPFAVVGKQAKVLIVGAAGGHEVLASLFFEAREITAVELNPVTVELLRDRYADYAGRLHEDPRVTLVNAEARSFLSGDDARYDLIWFVAPDSYAAMNASTSAAFVLSESYLYTVEMLKEALEHLTPDGVLCAQFGERSFASRPKRTARYLSTARAAFEAGGSLAEHVMVATSDGLPPWSESTVLLGRSPFSVTQRESFLQWAEQVKGGRSRYVMGVGDPASPLARLIGASDAELPGIYSGLPFNAGPVYDDSPFFWHFTRFRDAARAPFLEGGFQGDWEEALGEQLMLVLLGIVTLFAAVFLLLPLVAIRDVWRDMPYKRRAALYFASLGLGFMFVEVCLIQMLTLFLGYPTYSLSVTLFVLLVASGLGSLASGRFVGRRNRTLVTLGVALAALLFTYPFLLPALVERFVGAPLALRVGLTIVAITPLGLCLGMFMPLGLATVAAASPHPREYVAWAWAVNGFFSVLASILSTILAMVIGFQLVLWTALAVYAIGIASLWRVPGPVE